MKILHLPDLVGSHPVSLSQSEKERGWLSTVLSLYPSKFHYPSDISFNLSQDQHVLYRLYKHTEAFLRYRSGFDLYHFNFGSSFLHFPSQGWPLLDLPFFERRAQKMMTLQGCDVRQKFPTIERHKRLCSTTAACFEKNCYNGVCNSGKRDTFRQKLVEKADRYIDTFFALNPDLLHFLPKEKSQFLPYTMLKFHDIPLKPGPFFKDDAITIVHAPTQRGAKGTPYILKALDDLKKKYGSKINIILVENQPHEKALKLYAQADLFIDQVLVGWYGGVAVEVMKMGIPVAAFIHQGDAEMIQDAFQPMVKELPIIQINPFNSVDVLDRLLQHREGLREWGEKSLAFVNKWHDPKRVCDWVHSQRKG